MAGANQELAVRASVTLVALAASSARRISVTVALRLVLAELATIATAAEALAILAHTVATAVLRAERDGAVVARVSNTARAGTVAARSVVGAIVGAPSNAAVLAGPARVAEADAGVALALRRARVRALLDAAVEVRVARLATALVVPHASAVATALVCATKRGFGILDRLSKFLGGAHGSCLGEILR